MRPPRCGGSGSRTCATGGADEAAVREDVVRRAQWTVALATLRLVVPDDEDDLQTEVAAAAFEAVEKDTPRGDAALAFWTDAVRAGGGPGPGEPMDLLGDQEWFRRLALWVVGPLGMGETDRPIALGVAAATVHLKNGCSESFRLYAG